MSLCDCTDLFRGGWEAAIGGLTHSKEVNLRRSGGKFTTATAKTVADVMVKESRDCRVLSRWFCAGFDDVSIAGLDGVAFLNVTRGLEGMALLFRYTQHATAFAPRSIDIYISGAGPSASSPASIDRGHR